MDESAIEIILQPYFESEFPIKLIILSSTLGYNSFSILLSPL
jgi:hypothetical protein